MSSDYILVEHHDDIATVILNRPEKLNALIKPMWQQLGEVVTELSADDSLRCVVLRGAGDKSFAPGNDISEFEEARSNSRDAKIYGQVGGGLEIASLCDLRICGESSRFGIPINRLGLCVGIREMNALYSLVGKAATLEILLEGRVFGAAEALQKGLVTRVVADAEVEAEAHATARRIADGAPLVARWHKQFMRRQSDPTPLSEEEKDLSYLCYDTEDFEIGYKSFLAKTKPEFKGR